ncbi:MAG: hypothetical protein HYZ27_08180 [Deltaproteobacteria bacterium]|nr:hypothetical protein [Deltaproteobacteria bacterium]
MILLVHGPVEVRNAARFNFPPAQAANVWIITDHAGEIAVENATENAYRLLAPRADVQLINTALLVGTIVGQNLRVANSGTLLRDVGAGDVRRLVRGCPVH